MTDKLFLKPQKDKCHDSVLTRSYIDEKLKKGRYNNINEYLLECARTREKILDSISRREESVQWNNISPLKNKE